MSQPRFESRFDDCFDDLISLFNEAQRLPAGERAGFLDERCVDNDELREGVEQLLGQEARDSNPMDDPGLLSGASSLLEDALLGVDDVELPSAIGSYRILRRLGEGGMGIVFLAEQQNPSRKVALKIIREGYDSGELMRRFLYESRILGSLQHPGIAQIHEAGHAEVESAMGLIEIPFIAMEFVDGDDLGAHVEKRELATPDRLILFANICDAVAHAHERGIIHRDLKPGNILVDGSGQPKILDFGVARSADPGMASVSMHTQTGQLVGTLAYMSPEQVSEAPDEVGFRSDVYSLGVILYELLSGRRPHDLRKVPIPEAIRIIRQDDPSHLSTIDPGLRGDLDLIVRKALEKERERRYASVAAMAADIRRHLDDEAIEARPASRVYRMRKFARRHRGLVVGLALTFIVLIAGILGVGLFALRSKRLAERARAEEAYSKRQLYVLRLRDAVHALESFDQSRAHRSLYETPEEFRDWEWRYLDARIRFVGRTGPGVPSSIVIRADGSILGALRDHDRIRLIDMFDGSQIGEIRGGTDEDHLQFSPDGNHLAASEIRNDRIRVWNVDDRRVVRSFDADLSRWIGFSLSPDGSLFSLSRKDRTSVYEVATGECRFTLPVGGPSLARFSPDGKSIASVPALRGDSSRHLLIANTIDGSTMARIPFHSRTAVEYLAWDRDSRTLAMSLGQRGIEIRDAVTLNRLRVLGARRARFGGSLAYGLAFLDSGRLASNDPQGFTRIWSPESELPLREFRLPSKGTRLVTNAGGTVLGIAGKGWLQLEELESRLFVECKGHTNYVYRVAYSSCGTFIASGGWDHTIRIWDALTGRLLATLPTGTEVLESGRNYVKALSFSADGSEIVAWANGALRWSLAAKSVMDRGELKPEKTRGLGKGIAADAFRSRLDGDARFAGGCTSPDGRISALGSIKGTVELYDRRTGALVSSVLHSGGATAVAIRHDNEIMATGGWSDGCVRLWDVDTGAEIASIQGPAATIYDLDFSPDGRRIASGDIDGAVRLWDPERHDLVAELKGHATYVHAVAFSPDGSQIVSASGDCTLRIRDTVSPFERRREAEIARRLREQIRPRIDRWFAEFGDGEAVWQRVCNDETLDAASRRAALHLLITR